MWRYCWCWPWSGDDHHGGGAHGERYDHDDVVAIVDVAAGGGAGGGDHGPSHGDAGGHHAPAPRGSCIPLARLARFWHDFPVPMEGFRLVSAAWTAQWMSPLSPLSQLCPFLGSNLGSPNASGY